MLPVVIYAAKSSPDDKDSLATQLDACRKATDGRTVVGEFSEQNASGYKASRGPQLAAAIAAATAAAPCELWVWHTSRLGRGTGLLGEARALGGLLYELRAAGVTVRSVDDDAFATTEALWGIASSMASQYSENLSVYVKRGKQRQRENGHVLGGPVPDGYQQTKAGAPRIADPRRAPVIARMFELAADYGDPTVARKLNDEGFRRKSGKPWDRRSVQAILTNPHYGGAWKNTDGSPIERIVAADAWDAAQTARAGRDKAAGGRLAADKGGRPTKSYALSGLGRCSRCGSGMYVRTATYRRKDGTKQRDYVCQQVHAQTGTCDQPLIMAEPVDRAIVENLRAYFDDLDGFVAKFAGEHGDRVSALERRATIAAEQQVEAADVSRRARERMAAALAAGDDDLADGLAAVLAEATAKFKAAVLESEKIADERAVLGEHDEQSSAALRWWRELGEAVAIGLDAQSVADLNAHLREVLQDVSMNTRDDGTVQLVATFNAASGRGWDDPAAEPRFNPDGTIAENEHGDIDWQLVAGPPTFVPDQIATVVTPPSRRQGRRQLAP